MSSDPAAPPSVVRFPARRRWRAPRRRTLAYGAAVGLVTAGGAVPGCADGTLTGPALTPPPADAPRPGALETSKHGVRRTVPP